MVLLLFREALGEDVLTGVYRIGSPRELYRTKGDFYSMVKHSGEDEELRGIR